MLWALISFTGNHSSVPWAQFCIILHGLKLMIQNFAVFLGTLAIPSNPGLGAFLGYLGIFFPGLIIQNALLPIWRKMRTKPRLNSALKGVACGAIGLVYTAVYRLWQIGFINAESQQGSPITSEPWFVLVCATSFASCRWWGARPPVAIIAGGLLGMLWFGVVKK